MTKKEKL